MFHSFWAANSPVWDKPEKLNGTRGRIEAYIYKQIPVDVLTVQTNSSFSYDCFSPKNPWIFGFQSSANDVSRSDVRISPAPSVFDDIRPRVYVPNFQRQQQRVIPRYVEEPDGVLS